jgi:hypothetical protein
MAESAKAARDLLLFQAAIQPVYKMLKSEQFFAY